MCLCFKAANLITVEQLKQLGKTETMENLIVHKNDNENLLKIYQSTEIFISCCWSIG